MIRYPVSEWVRWILTMGAVGIALLTANSAENSANSSANTSRAAKITAVQAHNSAGQAETAASRARGSTRRIEYLTAENRKAFCTVTTNLHRTTEQRVEREQQQLRSTRSYIRDLGNRREAPLLYRRVKQSANLIKGRVRDARALERATRPPHICENGTKKE